MTGVNGHEGWSLESYAAHNEALRAAEAKFQEERDRRYIEVDHERARALQIKEEADQVALQLARDIQSYKDLKANELREQISNERGSYATHNDLNALAQKFEIMHQPVIQFMSKQEGRSGGMERSWLVLLGVVALLSSVISVGSFVWGRDQNAVPATAPQVIYVPALPGTLVPSTPATQGR